MLFRARLVLLLLEHGVGVWLIEADSTWFDNPTKFLHDMHGMDVVVGQDGTFEILPHLPEAGFIFLNSTAAARAMWTGLIAQQAGLLANSSAEQLGHDGSEMIMLREGGHLDKVIWASFPKTRFVGGLWYQEELFRHAVNPMVIQNNWLVSKQEKIARAKEWGHWFTDDDGECLPCARSTGSKARAAGETCNAQVCQKISPRKGPFLPKRSLLSFATLRRPAA